MRPRSHLLLALSLGVVGAAVPLSAQRSGFQSTDLSMLKSVGDVQLSPDGSRVAYSVQNNDRPGRPYSQVWILDSAPGSRDGLGAIKGPRPDRVGRPTVSGSRTSAAKTRIRASRSRVLTAPARRSSRRSRGRTIRSQRLASVLRGRPTRSAWPLSQATPGPEADANGDPMVIARYLYKPTASEGGTRFNDNRRLHIFLVDVATKQVSSSQTALTTSIRSTGRRAATRSFSSRTASRMPIASSTTTSLQ